MMPAPRPAARIGATSVHFIGCRGGVKSGRAGSRERENATLAGHRRSFSFVSPAVATSPWRGRTAFAPPGGPAFFRPRSQTRRGAARQFAPVVTVVVVRCVVRATGRAVVRRVVVAWTTFRAEVARTGAGALVVVSVVTVAVGAGC